ncbi:hypothetical protein N9219_05385 [bacterium]|nr:hypothetical protein [bacterium]
MVIKKIVIAFLLLTSSLSSAEESRDVPEKLFGIPLGGIYNLESIPVKKCTGLRRFFTLVQSSGYAKKNPQRHYEELFFVALDA